MVWPALPAMPLSEETQTIRPLSRSRPRESSSSSIRSSLERLTSSSEVQRSSGILAIVRSRVTPALWTTTSTPSPSRSAIFAGASSSVMSTSIVLAPSRAATFASSSPRAGTSSSTSLAPSRCRVSAIASPIPREAPVTSATLALQRSLPVDLRRLRDARADLDHLAGDVGGAGGEEEAQGGVELVLGAGGDVDELHGDAAADLLAERAGEPLQGALRGRLARRQAGRRRAQHDDAAAALDPPHVGVEEVLQLDQLGRVGDPGGVEEQRVHRAVRSLRPRGADLDRDVLQPLGEPAAGGGADQERAGAPRRRRAPARFSFAGRGRPTRGAISRPGGELTICE